MNALLIIANYLNYVLLCTQPVREVVIKDWQTVGNYSRKTLSGKKYNRTLSTSIK